MRIADNNVKKKPSKNNKKNKKKMSKPLIIVLILIGAILLFAIIYAIVVMSGLNHKELDINNLGISSGTSQLNNANTIKDDKNDKAITNIALFGVDQRKPNQPSRSDAIMILSVDKKHNKIKVSSVMRDTLVEMDGRDKDKITHAYYYGGAQLAVKTLNQNFNLNISEYASVNFSQMAKIIDAVDGIQIDITEAERKEINGTIIDQ
ncbi:MAG: LCP family protein, partial [Oscillospiraceae bacterium]